MALTTVKSMKGAARAHNTINSMCASRYVECELPEFEMLQQETTKDAAYQIISNELMLDGNPCLNLASFVTTWMEPECDKLIISTLHKNYIDMDEYPITTEFQVRAPVLSACICVFPHCEPHWMHRIEKLELFIGKHLEITLENNLGLVLAQLRVLDPGLRLVKANKKALEWSLMSHQERCSTETSSNDMSASL